MSTKMNPEVKAKVVAALRSGEYEQGKGYLHIAGCFCGFGVLTDVYAKSTGGRWDKHSGSVFEYEGHVTTPPVAVMKWLGFNDYFGPDIVINGVSSTISCHNDSGRTFAQIADAIEEQL